GSGRVRGGLYLHGQPRVPHPHGPDGRTEQRCHRPAGSLFHPHPYRRGRRARSADPAISAAFVTQRQLVGRTVTVLALIALAWLLVSVISQITEILVVLLISAIFASGLAPAVGVLERCRLPGGLRFSRGVAIFVLYLVIFIAVLLLLSIIIVPAVNESSRFIQQLPQLLTKI